MQKRVTDAGTPVVPNDYLADRKVIVMRETVTRVPELYSEVYVSPACPSEARGFAEMFAQARCTKADSPDDADIVVFTGGSDVNPALYGCSNHPTTHFDNDRDDADIALYVECVNKGIPMFGVCRGFQFGHVMAGGRLIQDLDGHVGKHSIWDLKAKRSIPNVSSVHHQAVVANAAIGMEVLADCKVSSYRWLDHATKMTGHSMDVEAAFYRDTCFLGVQGHPEYKGHYGYMSWCLDLIAKYLMENPDLELRDNQRRVKQELLTDRAIKYAAAMNKEDA